MNGRFQMQGGREVKTGFCRTQTGSSGTLIDWKSGQATFCPSIGPNGGSVAIDSGLLIFKAVIREAFPFQSHLASFWCINVSFGGKGKRGES